MRDARTIHKVAIVTGRLGVVLVIVGAMSSVWVISVAGGLLILAALVA